MSKNPNHDRHRPKKELDEKVLAHFGLDSPSQQQPSSRKRLKKLAEVNLQEQLVDPDQTEKLSEEEEDLYRQFDRKDDEELQREQLAGQSKPKKQLKDNKKLDSFLEKRMTKESKHKEVLSKSTKVQLTLQEMARIKKEKKLKRKISDDFILSDGEPLSQEDPKPNSSALQQYQALNGSLEDEQKLVQYAMKLSLKQESLPKQQYPITNSQVDKPLSIKKEKHAERGQTKEAKNEKKKTKDQKEIKDGPLSGMVIAFTGQFEDYQKDEIIQICMQLGADCPKSLTKKCNLLIQGSFVMDHFKRRLDTPIHETTKSRQAMERKISILPHAQLQNFFLSKAGSTLLQLLGKNKVNPSHLEVKREQQRRNFPMNNPQAALPNSQIKIEDKINPNAMEIQKKFTKTEVKGTQLWTQKYKPIRLGDVCGQNSQIRSLREWLNTWEDVHIRGISHDPKQSKGSPKAALLSGDPGIGKTTTARLIASELNFAVSEFNASDVRNRSGVNLMESGSYNLNIASNLQKSLIIMDEVDGMSSGDRGGVMAIIQLIKNSKVPIICICNDRSSEKIRSLANHCLDVRFHKPVKGIMIKRLKEILNLEGGTGEDRALELLVENFNNDMRQILSYLELIFKTVSPHITLDALSNRSKHAKDSSVMISHFNAARILLNRSEFSGLRITERTDLFFVDSDLVPLIVHQNLLASRKNPLSLKQLRSLAQGLKGMVLGDMLDRNIRKQQEWGLMPSFGFMTCVYPTEKISQSCGYPQFPAWLGKYSSERKNRRLVRELKNTLFSKTLCSSFRAVRRQYTPLLLHELVDFLKRQDLDGAVEMMEYYSISPAILNDHLATLVTASDKSNPLGAIPTVMKSKLTRLFNRLHEDSKLKQQKLKKGGEKHAKFNPVLQEMEDEEQAQQQVNEEEEQQNKPETKKGKKK